MTYLSEDPTYLAGAAYLWLGAFRSLLNITQQGKVPDSGRGGPGFGGDRW